jgi:sarcosine oxidase subunit beta
MKKYDIVIAGAGSVGLPLSWQLALRGYKVAVLDHEASWGRGQNRAAIGGIRATHSDPAKIRICMESIAIISSMLETHGLDVEWVKGGYLYVAYDEKEETSFKELLVLQRKSGLDIDWVEPQAIAEIAPGIRMEGLKGGTLSPGDGFASPLMTSTAFHLLALRAGVDFFFDTRIESVNRRGDMVESIEANGEVWGADIFVNAAGAEAADLASLAGFDIPVHPDCHEAGVTEPVERFLGPMVVDIRSSTESGNYYFYQAKTGQVVFCITPRPQIWGRDKDSTSSFLPQCVQRMLDLYPRLRNLRVRRTWRGMYPMTPDGLPIIGYPESAKNFLHAVGMCGQGFMMGPGLGKILAESIASGRSPYGDIFEELGVSRSFDHIELLK